MTVSDPQHEALRRVVADVVSAHVSALTQRVAELETYASAVETEVQSVAELRERVADLEAFIADPYNTAREALRRTATDEALDYWDPAIGRIAKPDPDWYAVSPMLGPAAHVEGAMAMYWRRDGREVRLSVDGMARLSFVIGRDGQPEAQRPACGVYNAPLAVMWRWLITGGPMPGESVAEPAPEPAPT